MTNSALFGISTVTYLFAAILYILFLAFKTKTISMLATLTAICGFIIQTAAFITRWKESIDMGAGHAPMSNMVESLLFFSWTIMLIYIIFEFLYKNKTLGAFVTPVACIAIGSISILPGASLKIEPLVPALKSNWLLIHVTTSFIGYAAWGVSFGVSIMILILGRLRDRGATLSAIFPSFEMLDEINYKLIAIGVTIFTIGTAAGSAWANYAWGGYWGWDPKETWSLITWFVYLALLHQRLSFGWTGRKTAWFSIAGFISVLLTYYGVNYVLPGLHSYG